MNTFKTLTITLLTIAICACSSDENGTVQSPQTSDKHPHTHGYKKPSAPIDMDYTIKSKTMQVGSDIEIGVHFESHVNSPITTTMSANEGLQIVNTQSQWQISANESGEYAHSPALKVNASANGIHYLTIVASIELDGQVQSKPFVIPLDIGNTGVPYKPKSINIKEEGGEKLIIQQAEKKTNS